MNRISQPLPLPVTIGPRTGLASLAGWTWEGPSVPAGYQILKKMAHICLRMRDQEPGKAHLYPFWDTVAGALPPLTRTTREQPSCSAV